MRIKSGIGWVLLIILNCFCAAYQANDIFGDMTYRIGNEYTSEQVKLVNGEYAEPGMLYVKYDHQYARGDFNHDGLQDAAVIITESGGGSGNFRQMAFLINDGEKLVHQSTEYLGDRVKINSIKERGGKVILDMFIHRDDDCLAGPTKHVRKVYKYNGPDTWGKPFSEALAASAPVGQ